MNAVVFPLTLEVATPAYALACGRLFGCLSAAGFTTLPTNHEAILKVLTNRIYDPLGDIVWDHHAMPYLAGMRSGGTFKFYMPNWARAAVKYARPGIDLSTLNIRSFIENWFELYKEKFPHIEYDSPQDKLFMTMFMSLGECEAAIDEHPDWMPALLDSAQIKRLTPIFKKDIALLR